MSQSFVSFAEVKRAVTIVALLEHYDLFSTLTAKGQNLVGACPFCDGKSTRQFQVNPEKNAWYCFGCKQGGNVLDFVAKRERVGVRAAALKLDEWFGLGLAEEPERSAPAASAPTSAPKVPRPVPPPMPEMLLPSANPPLTFTLKTLDGEHPSLGMLGFDPETIKHFGAGYCAKGLMKGRLAIPIHNAAGELVAYAGLAIEDDTSPRYLFPPKFHPALEVFNRDRLLTITEPEGPLYLAPEIEGVLRLVEAGHLSALGLFDGSLSEAQEEAILCELDRHEGLVLVGEGFADRTVARLARYATLSWLAYPPARGIGAPAPRVRSPAHSSRMQS
jgi:DNA primase